MYKIDENLEDVELVAFGEWNHLSGLKVFEKAMWKRRSNMKGRLIRYKPMNN